MMTTGGGPVVVIDSVSAAWTVSWSVGAPGARRAWPSTPVAVSAAATRTPVAVSVPVTVSLLDVTPSNKTAVSNPVAASSNRVGIYESVMVTVNVHADADVFVPSDTTRRLSSVAFTVVPAATVGAPMSIPHSFQAKLASPVANTDWKVSTPTATVG